MDVNLFPDLALDDIEAFLYSDGIYQLIEFRRDWLGQDLSPVLHTPYEMIIDLVNATPRMHIFTLYTYYNKYGSEIQWITAILRTTHTTILRAFISNYKPISPASRAAQEIACTT